MERRAIIIIGSGPGISASVARLWAEKGHSVGLLGTERPAVEQLAGELHSNGAIVRTALADITETAAAITALAELGEALSRVSNIHFNPSAYRERTPLTLTVPELLHDVALGVGGLLTAVTALRPHLTSGARITVTGSVAADRPSRNACSVGVQKAALRNLVHSLDETLAPDGVRAVSLTVCGVLSRTGAFSPDRVAAALWEAANQDENTWRSEVRYEG